MEIPVPDAVVGALDREAETLLQSGLTLQALADHLGLTAYRPPQDREVNVVFSHIRPQPGSGYDERRYVQLWGPLMRSGSGYEVLPAQTMEEAIAAARRTNSIDLLVVDAVMPEISGPELAEILLFLRPNMKILFITGLDGLAIRLAFERPCAFLQKPFSVTTLVTKIDAMLDLEPKPPGA